jgi:hypothetical protein
MGQWNEEGTKKAGVMPAWDHNLEFVSGAFWLGLQFINQKTESDNCR